MALTATAQGNVTSEYRLKAGYLSQFPNFIAWPDNAFPSPKANFAICVFGFFSFGTTLAEASRAELFHGRKIEVRLVRKVPEVRNCQILFVSRSEAGKYAQVMAEVGSAPILTVGETPEFLNAGGAITFSFAQDTLQFEFNLGAAAAARLQVSAHLLALAKRVVKAPEAKG